MTPKPNQKGSGSNWVQNGFQATKLLLEIVENASRFAPVPYLQQAASFAVSIVKIAERVQDNRAGFLRLAEDCIELIAAVCQSYEDATDKDNWPAPNLAHAVKELEKTLGSVHRSLQDEIDKNMGVRLFENSAGPSRIKELHDKLKQAIDKFNLSSHLNTSITLARLLRNSEEILDAIRPLRAEGVVTAGAAPTVITPDPQFEVRSGGTSVSASTASEGQRQEAPVTIYDAPPQQQHPQLDPLAPLHAALQGLNLAAGTPSPLVPSTAPHTMPYFGWPPANFFANANPFFPSAFNPPPFNNASTNQSQGTATNGGNISGSGNIHSSGNVQNSGNIVNRGNGNVVGSGNITSTGNGTVSHSGNITTMPNIFNSGNMSTPGHVINSGNVSSSGNVVNSGNVSTFGAPAHGHYFNPSYVHPVPS